MKHQLKFSLSRIVFVTCLTAIMIALATHILWPRSVTAKRMPALDFQRTDIQLDSMIAQQTGEYGQTFRPKARAICSSLIQNGNFEDDLLMSLWNYSAIGESVRRTSIPHYFGPDQSFSMVLPATTIGGSPRHPWLFQEFVMPPVPITQTNNIDTSLTLTLHVGVNPEGSPDPDPLYVLLLGETGSTLLLTDPITVATGADLLTLVPPVFNNNGWVFKTITLSDVYNPADYAGQTLRLYFHSPNSNDTASTRFYLDNIDLVYCVSQIHLFLPIIRRTSS